MRADVVALQEVGATTLHARGTDVFGYLLQRWCDWFCAQARTLRTAHGDYGHVLLSKWPFVSVDRLELSVSRREPRAALLATVRHPAFGELSIVAAHLGLSMRERRQQLLRLRAAIDSVRERPVIVLGDFNQLRRRGLAERMLCPPLKPAASRLTYPSWRPFFPLDRIWCGDSLAIAASQAPTEHAALSDHLPLFADVVRTGPSRVHAEQTEPQPLGGGGAKPEGRCAPGDGRRRQNYVRAAR